MIHIRTVKFQKANYNSLKINVQAFTLGRDNGRVIRTSVEKSSVCRGLSRCSGCEVVGVGGVLP